MKNEVVKLAIDLYKGSLLDKYSKEDANEVLRKALIDIAGGKDKLTYKDFRRNKAQFFEIIEEALSVLIVEGLEDQFSDFAEIRNVAWGDTNVFTVPDTKLFPVAVISDGNFNIRKSRLDTGEITVPMVTRGVGIYEELYRFLAGRIDWVEMVNRVAKSYNQEIANEVYNAIYNSYDSLTAPYKVSGAYNEEELTALCQHVEAATGANVLIFGTKMALSKVKPSEISDNMRDRRNQLGYYGVVNGYEMREIRQAHKPGTHDFAIDNNFLLIVPETDNKMVKIVVEGEALVLEKPGGQIADQSLEYVFTMKSGIAVVSSFNYGIYKLA